MHNCDSTKITKPGNARREFIRAASAAAVAAERLVRTRRYRRYYRKRWAFAVRYARELNRELKFLIRRDPDAPKLNRPRRQKSDTPLSSRPAPTPSIPFGDLDGLPVLEKEP